ncbi:DNA-binding PucR family transcriptional regulator [Nocardioides thalensis]|uniref:DNA-binding PucR family transcriptional regulator n=1 Tax=Nocardioides thalensis TaxID=1914755 RepID=A0A853C709_9ACTN|nr:PucR family transcriptional regulator [Nocardioides thalensis]NYJ03334.1 DNA-binding PucR family transcriptional regulator [Nocardioides thalensis]
MLSLRRLLEQPELELTLLVPGEGDGVDRELLWLHNTELADPAPYVRPGELVLTNGVWLDEAEPAAFVDAVRGADAAGIVFGLRRETPATPPALIAACRRVGLPLAEISIEVPFTAVTRAAATLLAESRLSELSGTVRRTGALASAISRGAGAAGILQVVRREHDLPMVVVDRTGRQLAAAGADLSPAQLRDATRALTRHPPPLEVDLDGQTSSVFLVAAVGDVEAALFCLRAYGELRPDEVTALEQAGTYLSLEVAKQQAVHAIEQRFAAEVLDMVQAGPSREADVAERLRAFGVDPTGPVAVLAVAGPTAAPGRLSHDADTVADLLLDQGLAALVVGGSLETIAFVAWPQAGGLSLRAIAEELQRGVHRSRGDGRVLVAVGGVSPTSAGLGVILTQARETCRAMQAQPDGPVVQEFRDLDSHRLLLGMLDRDALARFSRGVLGELRRNDRGGDLEATLRAFLELDGHYAATAERLHIHVNTLRNRLARLAELTRRDVRTTAGRVDLFLALEADSFG